MKQYQTDLRYILENGVRVPNRTGIDTISVFGMLSRYDLSKGFPAVTTKKLAWKSVVSELLWFIEGSGDERRLAEILYGTRDNSKNTIWTPNAKAEYWLPKSKYDGDLGRIYGVQWREWTTSTGERIDQLKNLIEGIKTDPSGRRHVLSAWNPGELDKMALPPCHMFCQFNVVNNRLNCLMYQRSADFPLGVPFNIASYSLLTHMIAQVCGLDVGEFIHSIGDAHIYINQIEAINIQLAREPYPLPILYVNTNIINIDNFNLEDLKLQNYQHHETIDIPFSV